jgi:hypothetical protein
LNLDRRLAHDCEKNESEAFESVVTVCPTASVQNSTAAIKTRAHWSLKFWRPWPLPNHKLAIQHSLSYWPIPTGFLHPSVIWCCWLREVFCAAQSKYDVGIHSDVGAFMIWSLWASLLLQSYYKKTESETLCSLLR